MTDPHLMTNRQLDILAADLPFVKAWVSAVEDTLKAQLEAGETFVNVKLEPTRPTRNWVEGLDVLKILRKFSRLDVVAPRKVLSPSQAEKTLGRPLYRDKLAQFVASISSGVKLVYCNQEELED